MEEKAETDDKMRRMDSLNLEAGKVSTAHDHGSKVFIPTIYHFFFLSFDRDLKLIHSTLVLNLSTFFSFFLFFVFQLSWKRTMSLAIQSVGVVYGDIGTSPLYVFSSTFPKGINHKDDILGVLSLIIYTILLVPLVKYVLVVLWANDNGEGM